MSRWYRLDENKQPVAIDIMAVRDAASEQDRRVGKTRVFDRAEVSTVFLGLDHQWDPDGPPLLFETMVFGGRLDEHTERYSTWDEAVAGHERVVAMVRAEEEGC